MPNAITTLDPALHNTRTLREHTIGLYSRLVSEEPHTTLLIPPVAALLAKVDAAIQKETALSDGAALADAGAIAADRGLNNGMDDVAVVIHGGKKTKVDDPKHQDYFGGPVTVWEAKKGVLGPQLLRMEGWPQKLGQDKLPGLQALEKPIADAVALGVQKREAVKDNDAAQSKFDLYELRDLYAEFNALAAKTLGDLTAYAQAHPEARLPSDWAQSCFVHASRDHGPQTIEAVDKLLAKARAEVAKLEAKRAELVQRDEDAAQIEADALKAQADADEAKLREESARRAREETERKAQDLARKAKKAKKNK